jgi:transposase-like protein
MSKERRKFSPEFKAQVALEALRGVETIHAIAAKYEVHPVLVSNWKKELQQNMHEVFAKKRDANTEDTQKREARLYQKIGQLEVELDWLKKKSEELRHLP